MVSCPHLPAAIHRKINLNTRVNKVYRLSTMQVVNCYNVLYNIGLLHEYLYNNVVLSR
jgi:hypothetical protein